MKFILTCEHGGNIIPLDYQAYFEKGEAVLNSHRGYDPGALDIFKYLSDLADYKISHSISRLLVELNRSPGNSQLFSEFTNNLSSEDKKLLLNTYYFPYRNEVEKIIEGFISQRETVLHLSIHTFTPIFNNITRKADIGILYDPSRLQEKVISRKLKENLLIDSPQLRIRYNYPYLGKADGFTTYLRKKFGGNYSGIELEINQIYSENNIIATGIKNAVYKSVQTIKKIPFRFL